MFWISWQRSFKRTPGITVALARPSPATAFGAAANVPTLNDHIPALLDELAAALQSRADQTSLSRPNTCHCAAPTTGRTRLDDRPMRPSAPR